MQPQNNFQRQIKRAERGVARGGPPLFALCSIVFLVSAIVEIIAGTFVQGGISISIAGGAGLTRMVRMEKPAQ